MNSLQSIIEIKNGKIANKAGTKYPVFGGNGIIGYSDEYNYENIIIIGRVGANCGSVHLYEGKCWVSDNALAGIPLNNCNGFNYYLIKSFNLNSFQIGSSQPLLTQSILYNINISFPKDLIDQQKIAAVLSSLDDKIKLNNKINAELEAMAKTLYDYWFVQFDFPFNFAQGKPNAEGKPYKSSGGKMIYNPTLKREIPEGWEVKELDRLVIEFTKGVTTSYVDSSNLINLNQKVNKGFYLERQYFKYLDETIPIPPSKFAKKGDILINSLGQGTLGRVHYFIDDVNNIVVDQHLFILRVNKSKISSSYLYNTLASKPYQIQIDRQITGSTGMQMLNASNLKDLKIICPDLKVLEMFEKTLNCFYDKVSVNEKQNQELAQLRDWLLPMLMNGQVKVEDTYSSSEPQTNIAAEAVTAYQN